MDFDNLVDDSLAAQPARLPAQVPLAAPGAAPPSFDSLVDDAEKYGSLGQQALTAAEGFAKGVAGPIATGAEALLHKAGVPGLSPEEQAGRESGNPILHGGSEALGLIGPAVGTLGASAAARIGLELPEAVSVGAKLLNKYSQSGVLSKAAESAAVAAGLDKGVNLVGRVGAGAFKGALETALYQTGDEVSKRINDPSLGSSDVAAHIGLSGLIGAVGGGAFGALSPLWTKANEAPVAQAIRDFNNTAEGSVVDHAAESAVRKIEDAGFTGSLKAQKPNSRELVDIAARNNWPMPDGMLSAHPDVERGLDHLLNTGPTIPSLGTKKAFADTYKAVTDSVDNAISSDAAVMSETQAGNKLKESLSAKLEAENEPIKQLYGALEPYQQAIPLTDRSTGSLSRNIGGLIKEKGLIEGSERYNFLKTFSEGVDNITNLQELKNFRTEVSKSSGPMTRDLSAAINEKLNGVEERAIKRFAATMKTPQAKQQIMDLLGQVNEAKSSYSKFKGKLETLGKSIGKSRVYGPQDFIDFVDEINPQKLARRLFNDNDTEFTSWFAKEFPDEMATMRGYQRGLVREAATKAGEFNPKAAIKEVLGYQPEMQKLIASPEEIRVLKDAKTYLEDFPKKFNPSGTAHASSWKEFFSHPTGSVLANLGDAGVRAFISAFGRAVPGAEREASNVIPILGNAVLGKDINPAAFKHAVDYATTAVQGARAIDRAARSAFAAAIPIAAIAYPEEKHLDKLDNRLKAYQTDESLHEKVGGHLGHYLPNHDIAVKGLASNAVAYLNGIRPVVTKKAPLDPEIQPSAVAVANYRRALALAESPLSAVTLLKEGTLTSQDLNHLRAMYPGIVEQLGSKLTEHLINHVSKDRPVPYETRQGLSLILGQPLDSSLTAQSVQANQAVFAKPAVKQAGPDASAQASPSKSGMAKMNPGKRLSLSHSDDGE